MYRNPLRSFDLEEIVKDSTPYAKEPPLVKSNLHDLYATISVPTSVLTGFKIHRSPKSNLNQS